ncbi:MAG TPA: hypothetical protein VGN72_23885 [Tepidisphaeraceae bacterium]|jgi:peptidoglycan/LPS O-acetylase OafA/YrhL|nr:hypothetical protein [Tepidisphaeraceae bacterium]
MRQVGVYLMATLYGAVMGFAALLCVAMVFGQSAQGLKGWLSIVPTVGTFAVMIGVGAIAFRSVVRRFEPQQSDSNP